MRRLTKGELNVRKLLLACQEDDVVYEGIIVYEGVREELCTVAQSITFCAFVG